ncbi:MAG: hypothetical protein EXQ69_07110 [Acidimicrobiia bacterium]|nr:hypothetical protein [Acidimicrobiia bacterium]
MKMRLQADAAIAFAGADSATRSEAAKILELLSAGFEVAWFQASGPGLWLAGVTPDDSIKHQFGLKLECLVIGNGSAVEFEPRTLSQKPPRAGTPLDPGIRFMASTDSSAEAGCAAWGAAENVTVVLLKNGPPPGGSREDARTLLCELLSSYLWRRDLFEESAPVQTPGEFFDRSAAVQDAVMRVMAGTAVAVFGLRKIGKSSVLARVADTLQEDTNAITAIAVVPGDSARLKNGRWWMAAQDMLAAWQAGIHRIALSSGSRIEPHATQLQEAIHQRVVDASRLALAFERDVATLVKAAHALRAALGRESSRLILIVDECDQLYPYSLEAGSWRDDFFVLWNTLQAVKHRLANPRELVFILAAADPSGVELGSLVDQPNPLFQTHAIYLAPMSQEDVGSLLRGIGSRMGLIFGDDAIAEIFDLVGGHPLLVRRFGSVIHRAEKERAAAKLVSAQLVSHLFKKNKREFYNQVLWILDYLRRVAPDEDRLLRDLALNGAQAFENTWKDNDLRETFAYNLERYGLVRFEGDLPVVELRLIKEALQKPVATEFPEQKRQLKTLVDAIEATLRARLAVDIAMGKTLSEAVQAVVNAIPSDAKNRPLARQELIDLGAIYGLAAVLEAMNWGDYEILLNKFHDVIEWSGPAAAKEQRLTVVKKIFLNAHLVRHNNDRGLRELIKTEGFAAVFTRFCGVRDILSA